MQSKFGQCVFAYVKEPNILNWSLIHKCILVLSIYLFTKLIWVSWKVFSLVTPEFQAFINVSAMRFHFVIEMIEITLTVLLIPIFHVLRDYIIAKKVLPHLCIALITSSLVFDWYSSGLMAAGTVINAMNFMYLMIVLFDRRFLCITLIYTILIFCFFLSSGLVTGELHYAPLFNLDIIGYPNFKNGFWLVSTAYSSLPPLIVCVALLSIILKQWRERELYITQLSRLDGLTAIYNRRVLTENLIALDQAYPISPYAIVLIDLDLFKRVNDQYGHIIGDRVLVDAAKVLQETIGTSDVLGRYGGEEFLIISKDTTLPELKMLAEQCRQNLQNFQHYIDGQTHIQVTCSIGIALSHHQHAAMNILEKADQALYQAKINGRNQVYFA